jgi:hypothetical protein
LIKKTSRLRYFFLFLNYFIKCLSVFILKTTYFIKKVNLVTSLLLNNFSPHTDIRYIYSLYKAYTFYRKTKYTCSSKFNLPLKINKIKKSHCRMILLLIQLLNIYQRQPFNHSFLPSSSYVQIINSILSNQYAIFYRSLIWIQE